MVPVVVKKYILAILFESLVLFNMNVITASKKLSAGAVLKHVRTMGVCLSNVPD